jgi:AcrR family transcriptional regulator
MLNENLIITEQRAPRSDAQRNRELLIETAQRLFAEHGVEKVSMSDIAKAAGVGKGTLYRHFPNGKPELCHTLLDKEQRELQEHALERMRATPDPLANLRWFLREVVLFVDRNDQLLIAGVDTGVSLNHPAHLWWRQTIRGLLANHFRANGQQIDLDYCADLIYVMLDVAIIRYQKQERGYDLSRIVDGLLMLVDRLTD